MARTRKIAAILVADVVGYSRLAGADEDRTLARLRGLRSDLIDPAIAVHHGRIVKRTGDGILVEFRSVVDAVRCAIEVQNGMVERNAGLPPERRIEFRVGIHLGDVVEESDGDLMGDGVNIAARLEGIAEPGAICLSEDAYRQVKGRLDLAVTDLGPTQLKNIAEPIRVYSLQVGAAGAGEAAKPARAERALYRSRRLAAGIAALIVLVAAGAWYFLGRPDRASRDIRAHAVASNASAPAEAAHLSIVVLPFANLSGDPSQDYFADGITENLTTDLSRIRNSFVIARNTAFTFKGKSIDAKEIGKELGVRYVLEGSVQRDQNRVRVNAQLIDARVRRASLGRPLRGGRGRPVQAAGSGGGAIGQYLGLSNSSRRKRKRAPAPRTPTPIDLDHARLGLDAAGASQQTKENNDAARALFEQALEDRPERCRCVGGQRLHLRQ